MQTIIPFTLYGGAVVGQFKENKETGYHAYFVTDKEKGLVNIRPTGVTTILGIKDKSRPLLSWAAGLARNYLEERLSRGEAISMEDVYESPKKEDHHCAQIAQKAQSFPAYIRENGCNRIIALRKMHFCQTPSLPFFNKLFV